MISIIISPKFNNENILSINLENKNKKDFKNIKLCFSLVYSIKFIEGASRMSSVPGLKESPHTPKVLPDKSLPNF